MENTYCVYVHINKINGKMYFGQTKRQPEHRWGIRGRNYSVQMFGRAIEKYGWDNFIHSIIDNNLTYEQANELEIFLIKVYDTTNPDKGYNNTCGGQKYRVTEKTRKKLKESALNRAAETNHKISESVKKLWEDEDYRNNQIKKHKKVWQSIEFRNKISESAKKYNQEHPDKARKQSEWQKQYYSDPENRKKQSDQQKEFYKNHPEYIENIKNIRKKYYETHDSHNKGKKQYTNGVTIIYLCPNETPPEGFIPGQPKTKKVLNGIEKKKRMKHYNNGLISIMCEPSEVPDGFVPGRLPFKKKLD